MGLLSSLKSVAAGGADKMKEPYKPWKPFIREYEGAQHWDVMNLYGDKAYDRPGLGYTDAEMEGMYGEGRDLAAGEAAGERQRTSDRFRSPGGMGLQSAAYGRAQQRSDLASVQRANELRRRMVIENAQQKRADLMARLAAVTGAYAQGTGTYNEYVEGYNQKIRAAFENSRNMFKAAGSAAASSGGGGG